MSTSVLLAHITVTLMPPVPTQTGASRALAYQAYTAMESSVQVTKVLLFCYLCFLKIINIASLNSLIILHLFIFRNTSMH